jgi:hypothetical protein
MVTLLFLCREKHMFVIKIPSHSKIGEGGCEGLVFIRSPWPAKYVGNRVNGGGIIRIEPWSEVIGQILKEDKIINPFNDILDTMVTIDWTDRVGTLAKHGMGTSGTEISIVIKVNFAVEVKTNVNLIFRCNGHSSISSINIIYSVLRARRCICYVKIALGEGSIVGFEPWDINFRVQWMSNGIVVREGEIRYDTVLVLMPRGEVQKWKRVSR